MSNAIIKEEDRCEFETAVKELIRIGIISGIIDSSALINTIYKIDENKET